MSQLMLEQSVGGHIGNNQEVTTLIKTNITDSTVTFRDNVPHSNNVTTDSNENNQKMTSLLSSKLFSSNILPSNIFSPFTSNSENLSFFTRNPTNNQDNFDISTLKPITIIPQPANTPSHSKPRTTPAREAVDPLKYISIEEQDGTKYACSKCGNVYKWRKSLNKHWKEKHEGEPMPTQEERERMVKFPPHNLQKHTNVHLLATINNPHKNIYIPNGISNVQKTSLTFTNNIQNYNTFLKMENKPQHGSQLNFQNNSNVMFRISKNQSPEAHSKVYVKKGDTFDQHGALDLSFKSFSESKDEAPLDYSLKPLIGHATDDNSAYSNDTTPIVTRQSCFQCNAVFDSMEKLNNHFFSNHLNLLPSISHAIMQQIGGSSKCDFKCSVCGQMDEWLCNLEKHFDDFHTVLGANPYNFKNFRNISTSQYNTSKNDINAQLLISNSKANLTPMESNILEFNGSETMVVIPKAPEDSGLSPDSKISYKLIEAQNNSIPNNYFNFSTNPELNLEATQMSFNKTSQRIKKDGCTNADLHLPYQCDLCEYKARWPSEMTQHKKNHSDEKPFPCPQCPYRSKWKWDVVKHLKRCAGNKEQAENPFRQRKTNQKYQDHVDQDSEFMQGAYSVSMENSLNGQSILEALKIENANLNFLSFQPVTNQPGDMERRFIKIENPQSISTSAADSHNTYPCEQCHFVGHSPAELRRHMRVHSSEKPFVCKSCNYSTKWKCDLKKHLKTYNHEALDPQMMENNSRRISDTSDNGTIPRNDNSDSDGHSMCDAEMSQDGKLKCKHCSFEATNLFNLVRHVSVQACFGVGEQREGHGESMDVREDVDKEFFLRKFGLVKRTDSGKNSEESSAEGSIVDFTTENGIETPKTMISTNDYISNTGYNKVHQNFPERGQENIINKKIKYCDEFEHISDTLTDFPHYNPKTESLDLMCCGYCDYSVESQEDMEEHISGAHPLQQRFYVLNGAEPTSDSSEQTEPVVDDEIPNERLVRNGELLKAKVIEGVNVIKRKDLKLYKCRSCRFVSRFKANAVIHSKDHRRPGRMRCRQCKFYTNQTLFMLKHFQKVHINKEGTENSIQVTKVGDDKIEGNAMSKYSKNHWLKAASDHGCVGCGYASVNPLNVTKHKLRRICRRNFKAMNGRQVFINRPILKLNKVQIDQSND